MAKQKKTGEVVVKAGPKVSTVMFWYQAGLFRNEDEARGAFKLAHQQGMDGLGDSVEHWIGADWREGPLPPLKKRQVREDMAVGHSPFDSPKRSK